MNALLTKRNVTIWVIACFVVASVYAALNVTITNRTAASASEAQQQADARATAKVRAIAWEVHQKRVAWQRAHPAEYARQRAQAIAAVQEHERQNIAQGRAAMSASVAAAAEQKRQSRIPIYQYWDAETKRLDTATSAAHDAAAAVSNGDYVTGSQDFSVCSDDANAALMGADNDVPDGWPEVSDRLGSAADELMNACKTAVSALDDQKPSEVADFQSHLSQFQAEQLAAVAKAAELWIAAGGNLKDL
jgi:hypothetical protein